MEKKEVYRFWALFDYSSPDVVEVRFPDLPGCVTFGDSAEEAHTEAREALEGFLDELESDSSEVPNSSPLEVILAQAEAGEAAVEVQVYMPVVREALESRAVKKTLTIPKWLNDAAEAQRLDFSQVLQEGLKRNLGIKRKE